MNERTDGWMGFNDAFFDRKNYAVTFLCVHALRIFMSLCIVLYCIVLYCICVWCI